MPKYQSAAELLELLAGPSPTVAKAAETPLFPIGSLSLQDETCSPPGPNAADLGESQARCAEAICRLEAAGPEETCQLVQWLSKAAHSLATSKFGCRLVQTALDKANCADRDALVKILQPHVEELYNCPHGNHVLSKIIEVTPSSCAALGFVIEKFAGRGVTTAKHRFGCRIMERLIEHCDESQIGSLVKEVVADAGTLIKHPYGNFVMQHLLEHWPSERGSILQAILQDVPGLAVHRTASHVVQKALDWCDEEGKEQIVVALLSCKSLEQVACNRYGSYVVEQLEDVSTYNDEVKQRIAQDQQNLSAHKDDYGRRVLQRFGLEAADQREERK